MKPLKIGSPGYVHWLEIALDRVRAGEPEEEVLADYGYGWIKPAPQWIFSEAATSNLRDLYR